MADAKPAALGSAAASLNNDSVSKMWSNVRLIGPLLVGFVVSPPRPEIA